MVEEGKERGNNARHIFAEFIEIMYRRNRQLEYVFTNITPPVFYSLIIQPQLNCFQSLFLVLLFSNGSPSVVLVCDGRRDKGSHTMKWIAQNSTYFGECEIEYEQIMADDANEEMEVEGRAEA